MCKTAVRSALPFFFFFFFWHGIPAIVIVKASRMRLFLAAISVGGLHRLDEFIFKR